jgi:hypothetical protein
MRRTDNSNVKTSAIARAVDIPIAQANFMPKIAKAQQSNAIDSIVTRLWVRVEADSHAGVEA